MISTRRIHHLIFFWAVCNCFTLAAQEQIRVTGIAKDLETGKAIYTEYHDVTKEHHTISYVDSSGKQIATKEVQYQHGYNTPEYQLHDLRFNRRTGSEWQGDHFVIFRAVKTEKRHEKIIKPESDMVIDAGFDYFLRSHWDTLLNGKSLPFSFAVADPLAILDMTLEEVSSNDTPIKQHRDNYRYFNVHSRNHFIGWAIPDINLAYDDKTRLLQIYQGPSNITDKNDKNQKVSIHYDYLFPPP